MMSLAALSPVRATDGDCVMFKRLLGDTDGEVEGRGLSEALTALQALDEAILSIHPDRYVIDEDASHDIQPLLDIISTFLGRPDSERSCPIEYEAVVARIGDYVDGNLLAPMLATIQPMMVPNALLLGALHEYKLRHQEQQHDATNLGREVQSSTLTLIELLNRFATAKPLQR
jgi:hypothetical protein